MNNIKMLLLSRFKKEKNEQWVQDRRQICKVCPYNTKNLESISRKQKIVNFFSKIYSAITFSENEDLGECSICTCPLFYKTREKEENCDKNKWKSIHIENKHEI